MAKNIKEVVESITKEPEVPTLIGVDVGSGDQNVDATIGFVGQATEEELDRVFGSEDDELRQRVVMLEDALTGHAAWAEAVGNQMTEMSKKIGSLEGALRAAGFNVKGDTYAGSIDDLPKIEDL